MVTRTLITREGNCMSKRMLVVLTSDSFREKDILENNLRRRMHNVKGRWTKTCQGEKIAAIHEYSVKPRKMLLKKSKRCLGMRRIECVRELHTFSVRFISLSSRCRAKRRTKTKKSDKTSDKTSHKTARKNVNAGQNARVCTFA